MYMYMYMYTCTNLLVHTQSDSMDSFTAVGNTVCFSIHMYTCILTCLCIHNQIQWSIFSIHMYTCIPTHTQDVSGLLQQDWSSPSLPDDPVERLVAMGFANRELNRELLQKHNHELQVWSGV